MKKLFILILVSVSVSQLFAQEDQPKSKSFFGVKAGVNFMHSPKDNYNDKSNTSVGYQFGATYTVPISKRFSFQPEITLLHVSSKYTYINDEINFSEVENSKLVVNYLSLPLDFKFRVSKKVNIDFGPNINFLLKAKKEVDVTFNDNSTVSYYSETRDVTSGSKKTTFGLNLGTDYNINEKIYANFRYMLFINQFQTLDSTLSNSVFSFSLGYNFK